MAHAAFAMTLPSEAEAGRAKESARLLASRMRGRERKGAPVKLRVLGGEATEAAVELPAAVAEMLLRILEEVARGNAVRIVPVRAELTTQEAADVLNISRPSLIRLLEEGKIDYRRVGTHRRVRFKAVLQYKRRADEARRKVLDELAAYDQELGI